ncbi:subtilisin-like protease SBT1.6 [Tanacetum coccineum]
MIGNGTFLHCTGQCPNIDLRLSNTPFSISPYVFPIEGTDVVLGMSWLSALGQSKQIFQCHNLPSITLINKLRCVGSPRPSLEQSPTLRTRSYFTRGKYQNKQRRLLLAAKLQAEERSINELDDDKKLEANEAGGVGMILFNGVTNGEGLVGDAHLIPACSVGSDEGDKIKAYAATGRATATINFKGTMLGIKHAFSGRGPNGINPEILKPDLIAPGVTILAAWIDAVGPTGLESDSRKTEFNILSGTSMSCPHVSGAAALLKSAHPDWSPAVIKSAIMTTASTVNKQLEPMTDESIGNATTPYDFGAGHLNLDLAMDPGLVYDLRNENYVSFLCSIGYAAKTIQTLIRRVRNVGDVNSVYTVKVQAPKGVMISVRPGKLVFSDKVRELSYYMTVKIDGTSVVMGDSGAVFGSLSWVDGKHVIRSPIVVTQLDPL